MDKRQALWSKQTKDLIKDLHNEILIDDKNWHKLKGNNYNRAAELLVSALSQIINNGERSDIEALIKQSLLWIKEEIKDPGCPKH